MIQLSPRDRQIADLLLEACNPKEIGAKLNMRPNTVKVHLNKMYMRAGITSGSKRVKLAVMLYNEAHSA